MSKKAFTLVELLAVMAIIGTIITFLFPVLRKTRERVKRSQCINNLRQHGRAWTLYLAEHEDYFPVYGATPSAGQTYPTTFGGKKGTSFAITTHGAKYRVLNRYVDVDISKSELEVENNPNLMVFFCPDDTKATLSYPPTIFDNQGNSYQLNTRIITYLPTGALPYQKRPFFTIKSPPHKVYLECCNPNNNPGHGGKGYIVSPPGTTPVMFLFIDGHVAGPYKNNQDIETYIPNTTKPIIWDPNGTSSSFD